MIHSSPYLQMSRDLDENSAIGVAGLGIQRIDDVLDFLERQRLCSRISSTEPCEETWIPPERGQKKNTSPSTSP